MTLNGDSQHVMSSAPIRSKLVEADMRWCHCGRMARDRDIKRFEQGKEAWNKWAEEQLTMQAAIRRNGNWSIDEEGRGNNEATNEWISNASVDFSHRAFPNNTNFAGFVFPYTANFNSIKPQGRIEFQEAVFHWEAEFAAVKFPQRADFTAARFFGDTTFRDAIFNSVARFNAVCFRKAARFRRVTFSDNAWFRACSFKEEAVFTEATFSKYANFSKSEFFSSSWFDWAESTSSFSLADAQFKKVPNFTQASFRAPVRLDNVEVPAAQPLQLIGDYERAAYYRALKKIAIESYDHLREFNFFASEIRERRCNDDPAFGARYLFGLAYEILSDFGRSILRPIFWWVTQWFGFTCIYILTRDPSAWHICGRREGLLTFGKAGYLSLIHSLPFVGLSKSDQLQLVSQCLHGQDFLPIGITLWTTLQTLICGVLIFLLLLSLRNHFRIK